LRQAKRHIPFLLPAISCLLCLLTTHPSKAQLSLGVEGGVTWNHLQTNISNRSFTDNESKTGYSIGIPLQFHLYKYLYLEADPNLSQKNYSFVRTGAFTGSYEDFINHYLQLPVMAEWRGGGKKWQGLVSLGVYGAWWMAASVKGAIPNILNITDSTAAGGQQTETFGLSRYQEKYPFNSQKDQRLEFGWIAGIGLSYHLLPDWSLFIRARYYQSLTDQQKKYMGNQIPQYNQTYIFSLGGMYSFK
jgi:hypothetical protein